MITAGRAVTADAVGTVIAHAVVIVIADAIWDSHRRAAEMLVAEAVGGLGEERRSLPPA